MSPETLVDLEGVPRIAPRVAPVAPATSAITQERAGNGGPAFGFASGTLALGLAAGGMAYWLGLQGGETPVETTARALAFGLADTGLGFGRAVSAGAVSFLVMAVAIAGRSFTRSSIAGLLAGALVLLDPATLAYGRLAVPTAATLAFLGVALAGFAASRPWVQWVGALALALAAFADPRALAWGPVLGLLSILRGHIYASPRHVAVAGAQSLLIPAAGAILHVVVEGMVASVPACLAPASWGLATLRAIVIPGPGIAVVSNPVTWFAGLGAILFLGLGGVGFGASRFRMARANGRLQVRLVSVFPPVLGRGLWLLLLAATVAVPQAWIMLFALALSLGVQDLGEDAPGFGLTLAIALLLFAAIVVVRCWEAVSGSGGDAAVADAMGLIPWSQRVEC